MPICNVVVLMVMTLGTACENKAALTEGPAVPIRFSVSNQLLAPITVSIDGTPHVALLSGGSTNVSVPSGARWLSWTSAKPAGADRVPIPDDIGEVKISVANLGSEVEISNVINGQAYFTASVYNATTAPASIGVYDGKSLLCATVVSSATTSRPGFAQIGYYKLLPATEVRVYAGASGCTGSFVSWPSAQLRTRDKTGWVILTLQAVP